MSIARPLILLALGLLPFAHTTAAEQPNIVLILADDLGFGELSCLNPEHGKIHTPHLDAIAASGMIFTDAHSGSSVCTPSRYGLLTGRYAWRTRLQSGVLTGGRSLIAPERLTLPEMLKQQDYHTCAIGKWHLGMLFDGESNDNKSIPVGSKVTDGPIDAGGFDEFHGFHHARQMSIWIDNDTITEQIQPIDMLPRLTREAVKYIASRRDLDQPFFLYIPWNAPHSPVVPAKDWQGKSGLNDHADFVMQTDDSFGQVVQALRDNGLLENTLIICSADNGTSAPTSNKQQLEALGHYVSANLRGAKADLWDGGHRVPFLVSWPGQVQPGSRTDQLTCLTDIYATVAQILEISYPDSEGVDSYSFLNTLLAKGPSPRQNVIHHSISGHFSIRQGKWKLLCGPGSCGWTAPQPQAAVKQGLPLIQLYDMAADIAESNNLYEKFPEITAELRDLLNKQIDDGRSTPGPIQPNDTTNIVVDKTKP